MGWFTQRPSPDGSDPVSVIPTFIPNEPSIIQWEEVAVQRTVRTGYRDLL